MDVFMNGAVTRMVRKKQRTCGQLPEALVQSVKRLAERHAVAVALHLDAISRYPERNGGTRMSLPREFLLELAAVMQLQLWEQQGIHVHLDQGLPSYAQAAADLVQRSQGGAGAFRDLSTGSLSSRVLRTHWQCFAWEADDLLKASVLLDVGSEDELAAALASFLWENREQLCAVLEEQVS